MQNTSGSLEAGGFQLSYRVEGAGAPAIVIGSALYSSRTFSQNLRAHLRLAFLDHRGCAPAPAMIPPESFELSTLVDDIERARLALGLSRVVVVGHSGHSYMALEYAKKYADHVSHVVMIGIAPDLGGANVKARDSYWDESVSPERKAALAENLRRLPDDQLARMPYRERFIGSYLRNGPRTWYDPRFDATELFAGFEANVVIDRIWGEVFPKIDITRGLRELDRPVFLALGRYDYLVAPPSSWDPIRPHFRDLTARVFEKSGHTPQYEEPELFDEELLGWLKKSQ
jgi:proline iminopeptidase